MKIGDDNIGPMDYIEYRTTLTHDLYQKPCGQAEEVNTSTKKIRLINTVTSLTVR